MFRLQYLSELFDIGFLWNSSYFENTLEGKFCFGYSEDCENYDWWFPGNHGNARCFDV